ncbi:MAG: hypothetical protein AAGE84_12305 [Cyanobacteria bacterium P01_G01_bin.39]
MSRFVCAYGVQKTVVRLTFEVHTALYAYVNQKLIWLFAGSYIKFAIP